MKPTEFDVSAVLFTLEAPGVQGGHRAAENVRALRDERDELARAVVKLAGYFETLHPDMRAIYDVALERVRLTALRTQPKGTTS